MKLVKCRTCGRPVAQWAKACPGCGQPNPGVGITVRGCVVVLIMLAAVPITIFLACGLAGVFDATKGSSPQNRKPQ